MANTDRPISIDLFSGAGGMSLGFEQAGFDIVAAVDNDQNNVKTYQENFPNTHVICKNIVELTGVELRKEAEIGDREIDVVFGGPPCQGFSLIGRRDENDLRNLLLAHFARLVKELNPNYFVVENVYGLMIGKAKSVLDRFINDITLNPSGYKLILPIRDLNANNFGVPQNRRRIFIIGYREGLKKPEYPNPTIRKTTVWDAIGDLEVIGNSPEKFESHIYKGILGNASTYAAILRGEERDSDDYSIPRQVCSGSLHNCALTIHSSAVIDRFNNTPVGCTDSVSRLYRLEKNGLSPTLRAGSGPTNGSYTAPRPIHPTQPRCITVREGARLQSFPDWFKFHPTIWHGFRQVGNSVPPLLARAIANSIIKSID